MHKPRLFLQGSKGDRGVNGSQGERGPKVKQNILCILIYNFVFACLAFIYLAMRLAMSYFEGPFNAVYRRVIKATRETSVFQEER